MHQLRTGRAGAAGLALAVCAGGVAGCSGDSGSGGGAAVAAVTSQGTAPVSSGQAAPVASQARPPAGPSVYPPPPAGALGVLSVYPPDYGRHLPSGVAVELTFSEPVAAAEVDRAARLTRGAGPIGGAWSAGPDRRVYTFQPARPLKAGTHYAVRVDAALTSAAGRTLPAALRTAFATVDAPRSPLRAGAAAVDVTPPVGVPLGGYGSGDRRNAFLPVLPGADHDPTNYVVLFKPSTGKRDPIRAKVLVLDDGVRKVGIVSADVVGASTQLFEDLAPRVEALVGIDPSDLLVCGTHTHHGPGDVAHDKLLQHVAMDFFDPRVYDPMVQRLLLAFVQADQALRPAELGVATVQEDRIGANRRGHPGRYDRDLAIVKVTEPGGGPAIATLFSIAVHPTAMPIDDLRYSADLAGEAERRIEAARGGVALYVNGAEGDVKAELQNTPRSVANTVRLGTTLADRVLAELPGIPTERVVPLYTLTQVEDLGTPRITIRCGPRPLNPIGSPVTTACGFFARIGFQPQVGLPIPSWMGSRYRFSALRLGDLGTVTTVPGEAITNVGLTIKAGLRAAGEANPILFGLTNGHMGYVTDRDQYDQGGREAESTLFGRDTGVMVVDHALFVGQRVAR